MQEIGIFFAQYLTVLLMGLQSLNVIERRFMLAGITSIALGACTYHLTAVIGAAQSSQGSALWLAFIFAGPLGIWTAMLLQPFLVILAIKGKCTGDIQVSNVPTSISRNPNH